MNAPQNTGETPLMRQHREMKRQHPGAILFFRIGDFYEIFAENTVVRFNGQHYSPIRRSFRVNDLDVLRDTDLDVLSRQQETSPSSHPCRIRRI